MQVAFEGIQYCCEALSEGKVQIEEVKQTIEDGVGNAKAIYKEVTGFWGWLQSLFGVHPKPINQDKLGKLSDTSVAVEASVPQKKQKVVQHIPDTDEIVQRFVDHVSSWFENHQKVSSWLEGALAAAFAKDVIDPAEILRLTAIQTRVDGSYVQLSSIMAGAPKQLGPLWSNFQVMQEKVKNEQAKRKNMERIRRQQDAAKAQEASDQKLYRNLTIFYTVLIITYFWWYVWALWQNSSHSTTH